LLKTVPYGTILLLVALVINLNSAAADDIISDEQITDNIRQTVRLRHDKVKYKEYYKTWNVVDVTEDTISLERTKKNGEIVKASIERSRRPYLEVGDRVRYDKKRNRLRKTLDK
jgi:hypothetical protein